MGQSRNVYITGDDNLDRILNDICARLDTIEGLRPDLSAGYYQLDADKVINTGDPIEFDYVSISNSGIIVSSTGAALTISITSDGILLTTLDGDSISINGKRIEIKDEDSATTFKIGNWS